MLLSYSKKYIIFRNFGIMYETNKCPVPFDQQPINEYLELKKNGYLSILHIILKAISFLMLYYL